MRSGGLGTALAVLVVACSGPPASIPHDGPAPADASALDGANPDAATAFDASRDAGLPDAHPDNPFGIHFRDVTATATAAPYHGGRHAVDGWGLGTGMALGDVDGDGDVDVVLARVDDPASARPGGPPALLRNVTAAGGGMTFVEDPELAALLGGVLAHGAALGDIDGDGDLDLFVAAAGGDFLLENDGGGSFADVTDAAGVRGRADDVSVGALFVDVNRDGQLDLYVVNHTARTPPEPAPEAANRLYLNVGGGVFEDVTAAAGVGSDASAHAAAAAVLDGTGDLSIYVANDRFYVDETAVYPDLMLAGDAWYRLVSIDGQGVPSFEDVAAARGVVAGRSSMGVAIADVDDDLTPDVYVTDWGENDLYCNVSPGSAVVNGTATFGIGSRLDFDGHYLVGWGARFGDFDRDGLHELVVVNGPTSEPILCAHYHQVDQVFRQPSRGAPYREITAHTGLPVNPPCDSDAPVSGRGVVFGDLDGDGDDDLLVGSYVEPYRFYENATVSPGHFVRVRLVGTVSAPDPAGAVLEVQRKDGTWAARFLYAGGDTYAQSARVLELGLGADTSVSQAQVRWPSGLVQRIEGALVLDATVTITEPPWLTVSSRVAAAADPTPTLTYAPVDETGAFLGPAGAGRTVTATRSDGIPVVVTDHGDGTYTAPLPHPGTPRRTTITVTVDGTEQHPRPLLRYVD